MLVENEGKNNFELYLISLSYPGINMIQNASIEVHEKNDLFKNLIKNRVKEILSQEEFEENYGILNDEENEENEENEEKNKEDSHEHQN